MCVKFNGEIQRLPREKRMKMKRYAPSLTNERSRKYIWNGRLFGTPATASHGEREQLHFASYNCRILSFPLLHAPLRILHFYYFIISFALYCSIIFVSFSSSVFFTPNAIATENSIKNYSKTILSLWKFITEQTFGESIKSSSVQWAWMVAVFLSSQDDMTIEWALTGTEIKFSHFLPIGRFTSPLCIALHSIQLVFVSFGTCDERGQ